MSVNIEEYDGEVNGAVVEGEVSGELSLSTKMVVDDAEATERICLQVDNGKMNCEIDLAKKEAEEVAEILQQLSQD